MACKVVILFVTFLTVFLTDLGDNGAVAQQQNEIESLKLTGLDNRKPIFHQKNKNPDGSTLGTYGYYDSYDRYHVLNYINSSVGLQVVNDYLPFEPLNGFLFSSSLPTPTPTAEERLPKPVFTPKEDANATAESLDTNEHSVIRSTVLPPPPSFDDFFQHFQFDNFNPQHIDQQGSEQVPEDATSRNETEPTGIFAPSYPHFFHGLVRVSPDNNETAVNALPPQPSPVPLTPFNVPSFEVPQQFPGFPFTYYSPGRYAPGDGANDTSGLDSTDGEAKPGDPVDLAPVKPDKADDKEPASTSNRLAPHPTPSLPAIPQPPGLLNSYFNQYPPFSTFDNSPQRNPFGSYSPYPYFGYVRR